MLYLDYAKPLYNGKYILNFFADSTDDLEQISHGKSFITKNGFNYGPCQPGSTVTITMSNSDKVVYNLDASGKWITTETISYSEVVANPESEATESLNKLKVNGITYGVGGGGITDEEAFTLNYRRLENYYGFRIDDWADDFIKDVNLFYWATQPDIAPIESKDFFTEFYDDSEYVFMDQFDKSINNPTLIRNDEDTLTEIRWEDGHFVYRLTNENKIYRYPLKAYLKFNGNTIFYLNNYNEQITIPYEICKDMIDLGCIFLADGSGGLWEPIDSTSLHFISVDDDVIESVVTLTEEGFTSEEFSTPYIEANPEVSEETPALTSLNIGEAIYKIDSGTKVTANVETTSETEALTSLEVAGTAYKIDSGVPTILLRGTLDTTNKLMKINFNSGDEYIKLFEQYVSGLVNIRVTNKSSAETRDWGEFYDITSAEDMRFTMGGANLFFIYYTGSAFERYQIQCVVET
jgi:hypothetical protein